MAGRSGPLVQAGLRLERSVGKVMGKGYSSAGEVVVTVKNEGLLKALNDTSKGDWVKVFEAGTTNGKQIEVHYFRNNTTGEVFDVKTKYDYWHQKTFKDLEQ